MAKMARTSKKETVFLDKRKRLPCIADRIPLFCKKKEIKTAFGSVKVSKPLSQTDRDILDAIAATGEHGNKNGQKAYCFDPVAVLAFLGHKKKDNHTWLKSTLEEMAQITMTIKTTNFEMIGHIIDYVLIDYREKEVPEYLKRFGKAYNWLLVFSKEFTEIYEKDYIVWAKPETIKAIIDMKSEFLKTLVRFCLTHEQINMLFEDILIYTGYTDITRSYKKKLKKQLIDAKTYLKEHFGIDVIIKDKKIFIFYRKNRNIVALDYQK